MSLGRLFGWLANNSEDITGVERTVRRVQSWVGSRAGSATMQRMRSFGNLEDFAVLRGHALNALCGALMDRRSDCEKEHPFCGPGHLENGDSPKQFIAQAVPNQDATTGGRSNRGLRQPRGGSERWERSTRHPRIYFQLYSTDAAHPETGGVPSHSGELVSGVLWHSHKPWQRPVLSHGATRP